ncbi:hypothetical protein BC629DRAFT_1509731 [Irpex lacteus]|nr:hypothetical protein BC629DRAFT_1509731 [Irpex lacteus]
MGITAKRKSLKAAETRSTTRAARKVARDDGRDDDTREEKEDVQPSRSRKSKSKATQSENTKLRGSGAARKRAVKEDIVTEEEDEEEDEDEEPESDLDSLHSDALDNDTPPPSGKRKRSSQSPKKKTKESNKSPKKRRKTREEEDEDEAYQVGLDEGQEVVGVVVQAPKTGRVPAGQISTNTLNFLKQLKDPACNDREWFKLHEPVFRQAEQEWKDFIDAFTDVLVDADEQIPHLPPKDVMHRIYRDVRFSNDKTPYKTGFSASFSRSGRKGIFAGLKPNNESLLAAGSWQPAKTELSTIRNNLLHSPRAARRLRGIISAEEFVGLFGEAKRHPKGERQNVWGMGDELKVAPKGVDKNHPDIDLLKLRSFAVVHKFTDEQVLDPGFREELGRIAKVVRPFVHCINDLMTIQDDEDEDDEDEDGGEGEGGGEDGEGEGDDEE